MTTHVSNHGIVNLQELYERIPPVDCKPRCTECCGPTPMYREEFIACGGVLTDEHKTIPRGDGLVMNGDVLLLGQDMVLSCNVIDGEPQMDCRFAIPGGCGSYETRPLICRIYGTTYATMGGRATCPEGRRAHPLLKRSDERGIMAAYLACRP